MHEEDELPPPSYSEVIQETHSNSSPAPSHPPARPPRPDPPSSCSNCKDPECKNGSKCEKAKRQNDLYTNNLNLPWRYSRGYYCKKCNNTGYKLKKGNACKDCWKKFGPRPAPPKPTPPRPSVPPPPLAPNLNVLPAGSFMPFGGPNMFPGQAPRVLYPGDPAIGGVLCPRCRGRGLTHFFLDEETCRVCNGIGRVGM